MNIKGLTIGVPVKNIEKSSGWYRQLLGEREELEPVTGIKEMFLVGNSWLQLFEEESVAQSHNILRLEVDNIQGVHSHTRALHIECEDIIHIPGLIAFFELNDIDGNKLSFYQLDNKAA
jgi:hypothetical protein